MTVAAGFFGKIPTRGDFVRAGLPGDAVAGLDAWCQEVLPGSRALLRDGWTEAWMEAPIWRFLLPPGVCGAGALAGVWLPSTDKAGRLFPLVIALAAPSWAGVARCEPFLDRAEEIGLVAVEQDVTPAQLGEAVAGAARLDGDVVAEPDGGVWWTAGTERVAAGRLVFARMPDARAFAGMLGG